MVTSGVPCSVKIGKRWLACCTALPLSQGSVYGGAGVPHAIGPGVFMLEIQEPSDLTVYVEPTEPGTINSSANNLGLGWSRALELFSYHGQSWEVNIAKCRLTPQPGPHVPGGKVEEVPMGGPAQPRFGVSKLLIKTQLTVSFHTYRIAVVTRCQGAEEWSGQQKRIKRGDVLFFTCSIGQLPLHGRLPGRWGSGSAGVQSALGLFVGA